MTDDTRTRSTDTARAAGRRWFARIASICGLCLLSVAFAAMPVAADKHGGNSGTGSDDKVQTGQRHDGDSHRQDQATNEPGDDRGMAENEPGDDKGQAANEPGDDNGIDANGVRIIPLSSATAISARR